MITKINWKVSGKTFLEISFVPRWQFICWSEPGLRAAAWGHPTGSVFIQKVWLLQTGGSQETSGPKIERDDWQSHWLTDCNLERLRAVSVIHFSSTWPPVYLSFKTYEARLERSSLLSRFLARKERTFHHLKKKRKKEKRGSFWHLREKLKFW